MRLIEVIEEIESHKFLQPAVSDDEFEDVFEEKLQDKGYFPVEFKITPLLKNELLLCEADISNSSGLYGYVKEPFGIQSPPDFLVFEKDYLISLDLKTSKSGNPMWNNTIPKQTAIYVIMAYSENAKKREIVYFRGCDVISKEATKIFQNRLKEAQDQSKFSNEELIDFDTYNHGWNIYVRANYQQTKHDKSNTEVSFVKHPNKQLNKQKVLDYLAELSTKAS